MAEKENLFAKVTRLIMFVALAIYPFGMIPFAAWESITDSNWGSQRFVAFAIAGAVILCSACIWKIVPEKMEGIRTSLTCFCLFLAALSLRLFMISILQAEPVSDFGSCYEYAARGSEATAGLARYLAKYSYLGAYAVTLRSFLRIFGVSVLNAQILNALVTSCIPIALFLAVSRVAGRQNIAAVAGFIYAVSPCVAIYTAVPSCEHFSQFYMAWAACSLAFYCTAGRHSKKRWFFGITTGILFGCVCVYKSGLARVIGPSFLMAGFCYDCVPLFVSSEKKRMVKEIAVAAVQMIFILFAASLLNKIWMQNVQAELGAAAVQDSLPFSVGLYKNLCKEGNGVWNLGVEEHITQVLKEHDSHDEVDQILYGELFDEYGKDPKAFTDLLYHKFFVDWCDDGYYYWTFSGSGNIVQGTWIGEVLFVIVPRIFFMLMSITISLGLLAGIWKKEPAGKMQFLFFVIGVIFLFVLALVLIEAQGRYKSNIMPFICIVFGVCMDYFLDGLLALCQLAHRKVFGQRLNESSEGQWKKTQRDT